METKETTEEAALNQEIKDAPIASEIPEISQPASEAVSETKVESRQEGETDQQFRSRLGRRVSKLEDNINSFIQEMRATKIQSQYSEPASSEYISTADDVVKVINQYETRKLEATKNYDNQYLDHVARLGTEEGLNDQEFGRLENLIKTTFNQLAYQNPLIDAERNFLKSMRIIDRERLSNGKKRINLKGDNPLATGTSSGNEMIDNGRAPLKLDKFAQDFVDYHKIPEDKARKWLEE